MGPARALARNTTLVRNSRTVRAVACSLVLSLRPCVQSATVRKGAGCAKAGLGATPRPPRRVRRAARRDATFRDKTSGAAARRDADPPRARRSVTKYDYEKIFNPMYLL